MKKSKWIVAAMSATAMGGQIAADDSWQWSEELFQPNDCYHEYGDECRAGKLLFAAEFLWWTSGDYYPFANNLFSNTNVPVASTTEPFISSTTTDTEPYIRVSEKWSPGVRVGLGWETEDGWQIWGKWTGYSNYARRVINSVPPIIAPVAGTPSALGFLESPIGAGFLEFDGAGTSVTAAYKLNYNVADLVFAKELRPECNLVLIPYAGVRATWIHQRQSAYFTGAPLLEGGLFPTVPAGFAPASSRLSQKTWGVGPRLGLGAEWGDWHGFTLLGNISGSILFGQTKLHGTTATTAFDGTSIVTTNSLTRDRYSPIIPNIQVQLGFGYRFDFNCEQDSIDIFAMWEGNYYWGGSNVFLFERGLGLNGLTTGIAYNW